MASFDDNSEVEVIVGTYEEFILGYKLTRDRKKKNEKYSLSMSFTNHSQTKSIRAIAAVGKYIAAGSADESINLINMAARVEHGSLVEQSGTIVCLAEHGGTYLFSGCEDGTICIWKKGSWLCEKTLKAHIGGVVDISVHPSGKLALSVGKDKALKTWNLVKGRCGYVTNLKAIADAVRWSPEGDYYAVSVSNRVDVYSVQTAKVVYSIPVGKRISCISFANDSTLIIAGDKESIEVHDIKTQQKLTEFDGHKVRVKAIQYVPEIDMLFTTSNDGFIKIWRFLEDDFSNPPTLLTSIDTTCRNTCMTVWMKAPVSEEATEDMEVEEEEEEEEDEESLLEEEEEEEESPLEEEEEEEERTKRKKKKHKC